MKLALIISLLFNALFGLAFVLGLCRCASRMPETPNPEATQGTQINTNQP